MPGIIEIWKKYPVPGSPVRFLVGSSPFELDPANVGAGIIEMQDAPVVKSINLYAGGAFNCKAYRDQCFVVQFEDSDVRRVIPIDAVGEIGYDSEASKLKAIKEEAEAAGVPELED